MSRGEEGGSWAEVVRFDPTQQPLVPRHRDGNPCRHVNVYVVESTRSLECRACGDAIDPFDYLWSRAEDSARWVSALRHLHREVETLRAQLSELRREEQLTKSRLRQARASLQREEDA